MEAFLQQLTAKNNSDCDFNDENDEEEEIEEYEFLETLDGLLINLPSFFGLSDQLFDQMLEFYFYDITKIGKYLATEKGKKKLLSNFGIQSDNCSEKLYLMTADDSNHEYRCMHCNNLVKGIDILALVCNHFFCRDCWISRVQNGDLKCLEPKCNCKMPFIDAHNLYPEIDANHFKSMIHLLIQLDYEKELLNRGKDYTYCPNCGKQYELKYAKFGCCFCRKCLKFFCLKCRHEAHLPLTCQENKEFKELVFKYSSMPNELKQYKQYFNCKIRLNQQKKEIQQIIHFSLNDNNEIKTKIDEILNQNLSNTRKIYEMIQSIYKDELITFDNFEFINDNDFFNSNDVILFKERYNNQFSHLYYAYQSIIKKEAEVKMHFNEISNLIDEFESNSSLSSYLYDLSIILDYQPLKEEFVYEQQVIDVGFEISSDMDEDTPNINDDDAPIFDDEASDIKEQSSNNDDNTNIHDVDNNNSNIHDDNNNNNIHDDNNNNNNDNDNLPNTNDSSEPIQDEEELLKQKSKLLEEYQQELKVNSYENPYKSALDAYMSFFRSSDAQNDLLPGLSIENDENSVEYSINKYLIRIFKTHRQAFLHFNRKNKNINFLRSIYSIIVRFIFTNDVKLGYDLSYYLILLRYFSSNDD